MSSFQTTAATSFSLRVTTPDGRYDVVRGKLCRRANPALSPDERAVLVARLCDAERRIKAAADDYGAARDAKSMATQVLVELGERGPVWWRDGTPDLHGQPIEWSPYGKWWDDLRRL